MIVNPERARGGGVDRLVHAAAWLTLAAGGGVLGVGGYETIASTVTAPSPYDFPSHDDHDPTFIRAANDHSIKWGEQIDMASSGVALMIVGGGVLMVRNQRSRYLRPEF